MCEKRKIQQDICNHINVESDTGNIVLFTSISCLRSSFPHLYFVISAVQFSTKSQIKLQKEQIVIKIDIVRRRIIKKKILNGKNFFQREPAKVSTGGFLNEFNNDSEKPKMK